MAKENTRKGPSEAEERLDRLSTRRIANKARNLLRREDGKIRSELVVGGAIVATVAAIAGAEAPAPTANVYEQGQKFLEAAAKPLPVEAQLSGESKNYVGVNTIIVIKVKPGDPPLMLYHTPEGITDFKPKGPDPDSLADPLLVKPGYSVEWIKPRSIAFPNLSKEATVFAGNLAGMDTESNRATDASVNYFISDSELLKRGALQYTPGGERATFVPATIGPDGNIKGYPQTSIIKVVPNAEVSKDLHEQGLSPANPQSAGH